jgi:hypothetical protein
MYDLTLPLTFLGLNFQHLPHKKNWKKLNYFFKSLNSRKNAKILGKIAKLLKP